MDRDLLARRVLADLPKLLTLLDRNPHSPTFGCFDRNHWHYKIIDFPSGMAQEFVWPLALAHALPLPDNPYRGAPAIRDWIVAALRFAARASHRDGSCDDYYPFERATGAAAFSLLAAVESYRLLELEDAALKAFFARRADWLAKHRESGRLSNHEALVVLCLTRVAEITGELRWNDAIDTRLARLLSWQTEEGWFPEYDGCDPGYMTLTISLLAMLDGIRPEAALRGPLRKAVALAAELMHPDGSFGGAYASRNTLNFFPHGFELVGRWMPEALAINDRFLGALDGGRAPCYADDHILGHHAWNYLLAWRDFVKERPTPAPRPEGRKHYPAAGFLIDRRGGTELYLGTRKGGAFNLFRDGRLAAADTQLSLILRSGLRRRNAVAHLIYDYEVEMGEDEIRIAGDFGWAKQAPMTPARMIFLRLIMLTVGRFFPDLVRRLLQSLLISGKETAPFRFDRRLRWTEDTWEVTDRITAEDWKPVIAVGLGAHQNSIYNVMSAVYAQGQLETPWRDLTPKLAGLGKDTPLVLTRRF